MNEELLAQIKEYLKNNLEVTITELQRDEYLVTLILDGDTISSCYS